MVYTELLIYINDKRQNMNEKNNLCAFSLIRYKNPSEIMTGLKNIYPNRTCEFETFTNVEELFRLHPFGRKAVDNYLFFYVLNKEWTVFFNDQINSDGCASDMYNLNRLFGFEGLKVAHNEISTMFVYYRGKAKRVIQAYKEDRWTFYTEGELMEYEHPEYYLRKRIKDRFNVQILDEYFDHLGIPSNKGINELISNSKFIYSGKIKWSAMA